MLNKNLHHCLCSYKIVVIKEKECNIRQTIDKNMPFMQTNMLMYEQTFFSSTFIIKVAAICAIIWLILKFSKLVLKKKRIHHLF